MKISRDFIWNLVYIGTLLKEYSEINKELVLDWNFPQFDLEALVLIMGTKEALATEKKYFLYYDIEHMDIQELKKVLFQTLDDMKKKITG